MNQTLKNFWAHRRQNAWIVIEIALVAVLSFYLLDYFVVTTYDTYLCRPSGDFERDHAYPRDWKDRRHRHRLRRW